MYLRSLAAGLIAALQLAGAPVATAADIYRPYGTPRSEAPDEDSRYSDIFRYPPPRYAAPPYARPRGYDRDTYPDGDEPDHPSRWTDRRRGSDYLAPMPYPPGFGDRQGVYDRRAGGDWDTAGCVPRHEIRRGLIRDGWSDFDDLELREGMAIVRARRPDGQPYRLRIDRCSGEIVRAWPIEERPDAYAFRRRPPGWAY